MRSHGKGSMSATTKVKVSSPEILHNALGQGFHILETNSSACVKGECTTDVPRSKSVAGKRIVHTGTWENRSVPQGSLQGAEKAKRGYDASVVGLAHSRGVDRVMPVEFGKCGTLEGVSSLTQRGEVCYAIH